MHNLNAITIFLFVNSLKISLCEVFTAITEIAPLIETRSRLIDDVELYLLLEEKRLYLLKQQLQIYKNEHEKAMQDVPKYLGNPLNAYTLIKRLTTDLEFFRRNMNLDMEYTKNYSITNPGVTYPSNEDLSGAAIGLVRLKDVYNLEVKELTEGVINGIEFSSPMLPSDCFVMGREMYNNNEHKKALPWFVEALNKFYASAVDTMALTEVELMEYIALTHYVLGDIESALNWTLAILEKDPDHEKARNNKRNFEAELAQRGHNGTKSVDKEKDAHKSEDGKEAITDTYSAVKIKYEKLCRGEVQVPVKVTSKLKCRYLTENHPFLILAPFKLEELYKDPDIYMYHDVLSDHEIEHIQEMAKPRLQRATVRESKTGKYENINSLYRIGKTAWIKDEELDLVARVSRRVQDMTTLEMSTAEDLHVVNYGIGGHYEPHYDFIRVTRVARWFPAAAQACAARPDSNASVHMSEVPSGGATVFTALGLRVSPKKGAAVFWMNLHPSGEGNMALRHAACPVLIGSKWVGTKWIHMEGQELIKPCNLQFQPEGINRNLPEPVPINN